jgi:hypothetical protein
MNMGLKLHNAARKYCIDRYAHWSTVYSKLNDEGKGRVGSGYSDEALNTFPRYNVLTAILIEIERIDADNLPEYSELSELLVIAGKIAESIFTERPTSEIKASAMQEERDKFIEAVRGFTQDSIDAIPLLPYRRVLSSSEIMALWPRVRERWGADGTHFYPLTEPTDLSLRAFDECAFHKEFPAQRLHSIVRSWGVERVYQLREYGDDNYLMSVDCWEPQNNGAEGFWFADALDWILYASHHSSLTTGGTLTESILSEWKDANRHEWAEHTNG